MKYEKSEISTFLPSYTFLEYEEIFDHANPKIFVFNRENIQGVLNFFKIHNSMSS